MIINGGSRKNGKFFAGHLANGETNERVTLCEMRNLAATTIAGAFQELQAIAMGTRCEHYFYHANINPREDEQLTGWQWGEAVDTLETQLLLTGHARFVVEHHKAGRTHRHVIWSRIDVKRMRAVKMTDDYEKHQAVARELERRFGLAPGASVLGPERGSGPRPARRPATWESFRGQKSGIDPWELTQTVTELYRGSDDAQTFIAALLARGYELVRGKHADYCLIDPAGHLHSLARRISGVQAGELLAFLGEMPSEA
jgi:hypothetical protein